MPPLKTYTFKRYDKPNVLIEIKAYSEDNAWIILADLVVTVVIYQLDSVR